MELEKKNKNERLRKDVLYSSLEEMMQPDEIEQMVLKGKNSTFYS